MGTIRTSSNCICDQTSYNLDDRCVCDAKSHNCYACYSGMDNCMCYSVGYVQKTCACDTKSYQGQCSRNTGAFKRIGTVRPKKLNLREQPMASSDSLSILLSGQIVEVLDYVSSRGEYWYKIKEDTQDLIGYVGSEFITIETTQFLPDHNDGHGGPDTPNLPAPPRDSNKYKIPELTFSGERNKVNEIDIINLYEEIDLHISKYESTSSNGYWCFHGEKDLGWNSKHKELNNRRFIFTSSIEKDLNWSKTNVLRHRHLTFRIKTHDIVKTPCTYDIELIFTLDSKTIKHMINTDSLHRNKTIYLDLYNLLNEETFTSLISFEIKLYQNSLGSIKEATSRFEMEYIKLDNQARGYYKYFLGLIDNRNQSTTKETSRLRTGKTITDDDIDIAREETQIARRFDITWADAGTTKKEMARSFVDTIKKNSLIEVNKYIQETDNCSKCDSYTCPCYGTAYGFVACQTCDGCNSYTTCSCDIKCDSETLNCSCDQTCYEYLPTCSCDAKCHGYINCACDSKCYQEGHSCTCDYKQHLTCTCNGRCHNDTIGSCNCNSKCYGYNKCSCDGDWR